MQAGEHELDFDALVRAHHATVYRCALRVLGSEADARDLTQEVFLEVLERPRRFAEAREPAAVLAWSATKKALAQLRGDRNRRSREEAHAMHGRDAEDWSARERTDEHEAAEVRGVLARLVAKLPNELRIALGLRYEEELTYAAIAEATGCSEPTAHDRVKRALDRLRGDLQRAGMASAIPALPGLLATSGAQVPGGLEAQLLSLTKVALGGAKWFVYGSVLIVAVGLTIGARVVLGEPPIAEHATLAPPSAPPTGRADATGADEVLAATNASSDESLRAALGYTAGSSGIGATHHATTGARELPSTTLTGRVVDPEGSPIAGVLVRASSREYQGKMPLFHDSALSAADGGFALVLPVSRAEGQAYDLHTTHPDYVTTRRNELLVRANELPPRQDLVLLPNSSDVEADWQLDLYLFDELGVPVEGADVRVLRHVRHSRATTEWVLEDRTASDANGRVALEGGRLGEKRVEVDPSRQGWQTRRIELGIDRPGLHQENLQLVQGLVVEGTVATVDGSPLPDDLQLIVTGDDMNDWRFAELGHGGSFRYEGLDPGRFRLRVHADGWSSVDLTDLEAGCAPLSLLLKRADDPRDLGTHMGELHGRLVDAETGRPVLADILDVESIAIWEEEQQDLPREELLALHRTQRPYQIAMHGDWPDSTPDFHETGLPPRRYLAAARVDGYAPCFAGPFDLAAGELVNDIELRLERGGSLAGRVVDEQGRGVDGAHLFLAPDSELGRRRLLELDHLMLDEGERSLFECERVPKGGTFLVEHVPVGQPYLLCVLSREHAPKVVGPVEWK
ncbi:MAG: sigma-70 family RNA polymerase sigma factor, partial [Planctomycetes bacterium]|nr:sigma-70 family RNA polymerase sigma factor [Planctomycetota bacterium]